MMILGGWVATIPEFPVKTGLGKIIYEYSLNADALGKRLSELRCGRQTVNASESSNSGFADFIQAIAEPERPDLTIEKLTGVFDVLKPHLVDVYERTMRETDQICDAPTVDLLEDAVRRSRRHITWGRDRLDRLYDTDALRERRRLRVEELRGRLNASGGVTGTLETEGASLN